MAAFRGALQSLKLISQPLRSLATGNTSKFVIETLTEKNAKDAFSMLQREFRVDEALNIAVNLQEEDSRDAFTDMVNNAVLGGVSYVTMDPNIDKVVSLQLNLVAQRNQPPRILQGDYPEPMSIILQFISDLEGDFFQYLPEDAESIFVMRIASVDKSYQGYGVGQRLLNYSIQKAIDGPYDYMVVVGTSFIVKEGMQRKHGFIPVRSLSVKDYTYQGKKPFASIARESAFALLLGKKIHRNGPGYDKQTLNWP